MVRQVLFTSHVFFFFSFFLGGMGRGGGLFKFCRDACDIAGYQCYTMQCTCIGLLQ